MGEDLSALMAADAEEARSRVPSDQELATVAQLANEQLRLLKLVSDKERELEDARSQLAKVQKGDLPTLVESMGMRKFVLTNGFVVSIEEKIHAGITQENQERAFEWLKETDNDGIIKNKVEVPFGKGQDDEASALMEVLKKHGYSYSNSRSVHPSTLKAFVKRRLEDGLPTPTDVFSIYVEKVATISLPK